MVRLAGKWLILVGLFGVLAVACSSELPTPTPTPSYREIPADYPFTMNVLSGWRSRDTRVAGGRMYTFREPDPDRSSGIAVFVLNRKAYWQLDSDAVADVFVEEMEEGGERGQVEVRSRTVQPDGAIRLSLEFQQSDGCESKAVVLVQRVPPIWTYIAEAGACSEDWDEYESVLVDAIDSFVPTN